MLSLLSVEFFQRSLPEDPGNRAKALKDSQASIKTCLCACTHRCFSAQSSTGVTQSKVLWHVSITVHGVFLCAFFFCSTFWRCTIARAHRSRCGDVYLAVSSVGQDLLITLPPRSPCSVAHCHHSYRTETEPHVLQFPGEEENLNTCILLLLSRRHIPNSTGNQSSLCQKLPPPPDKAFKFVVSNGI